MANARNKRREPFNLLKRKDDMMNPIKIVPLVVLLLLTACTGDGTTSSGGHSFGASDRDGDAALNYDEFRHHANTGAREQGADAMNRRAAEQIAGNRELHKKFIYLDRNNDGRVSQLEMNGY